MKRFLTCTAAAALLAAPAHAEFDRYDHGFSSGVASTSCIHHNQRNITRTEFLQDLKRARKDLDPDMADALITRFALGAMDPELSSRVSRAFRKCHSASKHLLNIPVNYGSHL